MLHILVEREEVGENICLGQLGIPNSRKEMGGWGIKSPGTFSTALADKLGWHLIISRSLWTTVAISKYISPKSRMELLRQPQWNYVGKSIIWKAVL